MFKNILFLLALLITISSCGKSHEEKAQDSLIGNWKVTKAASIDPNSVQVDTTGDLGTFVFTATNLDYSYTIVNEKSRSSEYTFTRTKENAGFFKVDVYTIDTGNESIRVRFGDETSDAHCEATEIGLEFTAVTPDDLQSTVFLELEKM